MYLNTHTYYSLRYGTIPPEALLQQALSCGVTAMALTDINSTSAQLDIVRFAKKYGIKPVLGVDFRNGAQQQFVMLAQNNNALQQLNKYLSKMLHSNKFIVPERAKYIPETFVIYPFQPSI
ncbi:PHP domain-containing protein [Lutibacter sp.]|uniref:PHP domain-containing protein n=1 Tax=Lutibacter sp. TaxID=1925666 RepID=UPI002736F484|nr:PHP domain-containing protein [Lutibacter sp.]MDP3312428.1 PHP domain-containing protein [Lutibacter sp.]